MGPSSTSTFRRVHTKAKRPAILLLDDDDEFRCALAATLRDDGWEVFDYADAAEVPSLDTLEVPISLITDHRMRGSDGVTFSDRFHHVHADAPVILMTSYSTAALEAAVAERPYVTLLRKPIDYAMLLTLL
jgi:FixJ family two-component response regulator